jgi:hypothetical protein
MLGAESNFSAELRSRDGERYASFIAWPLFAAVHIQFLKYFGRNCEEFVSRVAKLFIRNGRILEFGNFEKPLRGATNDSQSVQDALTAGNPAQGTPAAAWPIGEKRNVSLFDVPLPP